VYGAQPVGKYTGMDGASVQYLAGRYRLIERLGAGGMSVVWRAYDEVLGRPVAVKLLGPRFAADPASRERIRAEARAAARLNHLYITDVYDYGESASDSGTVPFVVMELVDGVPLSDRLRGDPLPWRFATEVCAQVAAALAAIHARGLVHRDVKPANIMLTGAGAKIVDFGISAVAGDRSERPGQVFGTPAYLAPERLDGGPADAASDVYALGLVLYKALSGDLPWDADTTTQMLTAHCHVTPAPLPPVDGLPDAVADLCRRSLAKKPSERPSAAEVARTLSGAVAMSGSLVEAPVSPAPSPTDVRTQTRPYGVSLRLWMSGAAARFRTARHRPRTLRLAAAALALAVVAFGVAAWAHDPAQPHAEAAGPDLAAPAAAPELGCRVEYRTTVDTGGQFKVDLTVVNTGAAALPRWTLAFSYPGDQRVLAVVGAMSTQDGSSVLLAGETPLASGAAAKLSLVGAYVAGNPMPIAFELAGHPCVGQVVGAAAPPQVAGGGAGAGGGPAAGPGAGGPEAKPGPGPGSNSGPGSENSGKGKGKKGKDDDEDDDD
jgi:eukaryotic-like serine/threonine-protein kinase